MQCGSLLLGFRLFLALLLLLVTRLFLGVSLFGRSVPGDLLLCFALLALRFLQLVALFLTRLLLDASCFFLTLFRVSFDPLLINLGRLLRKHWRKQAESDKEATYAGHIGVCGYEYNSSNSAYARRKCGMTILPPTTSATFNASCCSSRFAPKR